MIAHELAAIYRVFLMEYCWESFGGVFHTIEHPAHPVGFF